MCGPEYAADAVGVALSLEKMLAAHRAGARFSVPKTRTWALDAGPALTS